MKSINWKQTFPHLIAIFVFLLTAIIYCHPALSGDVLQQGDMIHWKAMAQDAFNYKALHGHFPLWNTHLFSGMPNYQVAMEGQSFLPNFTAILTLWLPKPIAFFFLGCICFYILTQTVGLKPIIGVLASMAFAYATYNPVIVVAGHESKLFAMCYMPALIAGLILLYEGRYALGMIVTTLFATMEIGANHPQVTYYLLTALAILTIAYILRWIKEKNWKHTVIALGLAVLAGLISLGNQAMAIFPTYQYSKYTIRGGGAIDINNPNPSGAPSANTGLEESYAFQYSLGKAETFELAMPNAFGGYTGNMFEEGSDMYNQAMQLGGQLNGKLPADQLNSVLSGVLSKYWGGVVPFTSGPIYAGTLIVLLAIIGWVVTKSKHKWWLLAATLLSTFMAWGNYFESFNQLLFDHLPLYNKFRAPSMAMIIPQLTLPLMAGIALQKLFFNKDVDFIKKNNKKILYALAGFIALLLVIYMGQDYSLNNAPLRDFLNQPQVGGSGILHALADARKSMFLAGIGKVLLFSVILVAAIYAYTKNMLKPAVAIGLLLIITMVDLLKVDSQYLKADQFIEPATFEASAFSASPADQQILMDKDPHFRVLNLASGDPFTDAVTSYHHRSVGGYHAAKLLNYQNMIGAYMHGSLNQPILNMLDTRYIITPGGAQGQLSVQQNPEALGAAWFVKKVVPVSSEVDALKAIGHFNPADTAFVLQSDLSKAGAAPIYDSTASIQLVTYDNDSAVYHTQAATPQFAVLSEVYYPAGWNAYIDGKKVDYVATNYLLRGISVPAGNHDISFKFEPTVISKCQTAGYTSNIAFWLVMACAIFVLVKKSKANKQASEA